MARILKSRVFRIEILVKLSVRFFAVFRFLLCNSYCYFLVGHPAGLEGMDLLAVNFAVKPDEPAIESDFAHFIETVRQVFFYFLYSRVSDPDPDPHGSALI